MPFAQADLPGGLAVGLQLLVLSFLAAMAVVYLVRQLGETGKEAVFFRVLFPPRRARIVPWGVSAIVPVLVIYLLMTFLSQLLVIRVLLPGPVPFLHSKNIATEVLPLEIADGPSEETPDKPGAGVIKPIPRDELPEQHPLTVLMQVGGHAPLVLLVCFLTAVVVAPLMEEILFRVVIQGGIEASLRRTWGRSAWAMRLPVLITALFFAMIHFRTRSESEPNIDLLFKAMTANLLGSLATLSVVGAFLRVFYRARPVDFGLRDFRRIGRDALGSFLLLLALLIPVYIVNVSVTTFAKSQWAAAIGLTSAMIDPIPLFLFALVIGTLYYRTRRIASVFFLHAFFNLYSFLILLYLAFSAG